MASQLRGFVIFSSSLSIVQGIKHFNIIHRAKQFLSLPRRDSNHFTIEFTGRNEMQFQRQGTWSALTGRLTTITALKCVYKLWGSTGHLTPPASYAEAEPVDKLDLSTQETYPSPPVLTVSLYSKRFSTNTIGPTQNHQAGCQNAIFHWSDIQV